MEIYIALLRGINVGGKNLIKMADLQNLCSNLGLQNISTYIQSGNIVFGSKSKSKDAIQKLLETSIKSSFSLDVPVVVKKYDDLKKAVEAYPFPYNAEDKIVQAYISFAQNKIAVDATKIPSEKFTPDKAIVDENGIYYFYKDGAGQSKLTNAAIEKICGCIATQRNIKTCYKLLEMAEEIM
jgi:uncharacterized protein (DUF1697 family)